MIFKSDSQNSLKNVSTNIIVSNLNKGLGDLYNEFGRSIFYDCVGDDKGSNADAMLIVYELNYPQFIINNLKNRPMFGVSQSNIEFATNAGYPESLCRKFNLGVDSDIWRPQERLSKDKFTVLSFSESQTRGGFYDVIHSFGAAFQNHKDVRLVLKDRATTDLFRQYVNYYAQYYNIEILLDSRDLESFDEQRQIYADADLMLYLNYSSTWAMTALQSLSCGLPLMTMHYCGPAEYLTDNNGIKVEYTLEELTDNKLYELQSYGLRNYLFPRSMYHIAPYWAQPKMDDVIDKLKYYYNNQHLLEPKRNEGVLTAKELTWEKSALNFNTEMEKFFN